MGIVAPELPITEIYKISSDCYGYNESIKNENVNE